MTTKFSMGRDINGYNSFSLIPTDTKYSLLLAATVPQTITLPTEEAMYRVIFVPEPGAKVWAAYDDTAAIPTGAAALTTSEQNPTVRDLPAGTVISLVTSNTTVEMGVEIYALQ